MIGVSASASVLPMSIQFLSIKVDWLDLLAVHPRDSQESSPAPQFKTSIFRCSTFFMVCLSQPYDYWKDHSQDLELCQKVMSLIFNTLSRFVIAFLPRSKRLLISRLQSPSTVILEPKKRKSVTTSTFSLFICHEVMGPDAMILFFNIYF